MTWRFSDDRDAVKTSEDLEKDISRIVGDYIARHKFEGPLEGHMDIDIIKTMYGAQVNTDYFDYSFIETDKDADDSKRFLLYDQRYVSFNEIMIESLDLEYFKRSISDISDHYGLDAYPFVRDGNTYKDAMQLALSLFDDDPHYTDEDIGSYLSRMDDLDGKMLGLRIMPDLLKVGDKKVYYGLEEDAQIDVSSWLRPVYMVYNQDTEELLISTLGNPMLEAMDIYCTFFAGHDCISCSGIDG